jgi:alpha-beta hydrolase superfamily lysophospholipase
MAGRIEPAPHAPPAASGPLYFCALGAPASGAGGPRELFGWYHASAGPLRGGVLVCNPVGDDAVRAHRPLRHLAERLARAGFAVLRFDYDGTGDSAGDERSPDRVDAWLADLCAAASMLRALSGAASVSAVGVRLGGTLAMACASAAGLDRVICWGGYARGSAFVASALQFYKLHRKLEPKSFAGGPANREDGEEVFGFLLTHGTLAELRTLDVRAAPFALPSAGPSGTLRRVLLVGDGSGRAEQTLLEQHLRASGLAPEVTTVTGCLQFLVEVPHKSRLPEEALDAMVGWLSADAEPGARSDTSAVSRAAVGPDGETALVFGRDRTTFGILHPPTVDPGRPLPPIVLASAGTVHRIGPHRMYVGLARRWASLGFTVLRLDLPGIGDTPAGEDGVENVTYPRGGYDSVVEAMDLLGQRTGAGSFVVAGLCSGGDFAFQMGLRDPRVIGSLILNPRTFCVNDLAAVETGNFESVLAAADRTAAERGEALSVPESLRTMVTRGVNTLLVVSEDDPGVHYVDLHWGDAMRALAGVPGFRREDIAGTDHNFTSLWAQQRVSDLVAEHLVRTYLSGPEKVTGQS